MKRQGVVHIKPALQITVYTVEHVTSNYYFQLFPQRWQTAEPCVSQPQVGWEWG